MPATFKSAIAVASAVAISLAFASAPAPAAADDEMNADATYKEVEQMLGGVPTFLKLYPKVAVASAWGQVRDLELNDKTAIPVKYKALISLAVSAQIPCYYCVWADTATAKQAGATDDEVAEAVAMAGLTRQWSTFFNGMQIDFETFKKEMGGE